MAELLVRARQRNEKGWFLNGHLPCKSKPIKKLLKRVCLICNKKFLTWECRIKKGSSKYCSKNCYTQAQVGKTPWNKGIGKINRCMDCSNIIPNRNAKRCRTCDTKFRQGKNAPCWRGGVSKLPYSFDFNNELKELIRKRDNYKCKICGVSQLECIEKLCIHHIDYNKKNSNPINLISLCASCHSKTNHHQEYWKEKLEVTCGGVAL